MSALTVLHVLEAVAHGTGRHVIDVVGHTDVRHEVVVPLAPTSRGETAAAGIVEQLQQAGVVVHRVPMRRNPLHPDLQRAVRAVRELIDSRHVDVVHGHATVGGIVARRAAARADLAAVYTPNGVHPSAAVRRVERRLGRTTAAVIAVSDSEADLLATLGVCPRERIVTVPNGIDLRPPPPHGRHLREELDLSTVRVIGWVGRLARQKGPDVLMDALARLPSDIHAVLVGGGPWSARIRRRSRQSDILGRVHLLGHVPDAARLLPQFDVLAQPSRWEGAPYVPLEAFRAGVPVVATDVVGNLDVVLDGHTGLLVRPDDPHALADGLRRILDDRAAAAQLASRAWAALVEHHDVRTMGAATGAVYRRVATRE